MIKSKHTIMILLIAITIAYFQLSNYELIISSMIPKICYLISLLPFDNGDIFKSVLNTSNGYTVEWWYNIIPLNTNESITLLIQVNTDSVQRGEVPANTSRVTIETISTNTGQVQLQKTALIINNNSCTNSDCIFRDDTNNIYFSRNNIFVDMPNVFVNLSYNVLVKTTQPLIRTLPSLLPHTAFPMKWYIHGLRVHYKGNITYNNVVQDIDIQTGYMDRNFGKPQSTNNIPNWIWIQASFLHSDHHKSMSLAIGGMLVGNGAFAFINDERERFQNVDWIHWGPVQSKMIKNTVTGALTQEIGLKFEAPFTGVVAYVICHIPFESVIDKDNIRPLSVVVTFHANVKVILISNEGIEIYETKAPHFAHVEIDRTHFVKGYEYGPFGFLIEH